MPTLILYTTMRKSHLPNRNSTFRVREYRLELATEKNIRPVLFTPYFPREPPSLCPHEFLAAVVSKVWHYESVWILTGMGKDMRILGRGSEFAENCCKSKPTQH